MGRERELVARRCKTRLRIVGWHGADLGCSVHQHIKTYAAIGNIDCYPRAGSDRDAATDCHANPYDDKYTDNGIESNATPHFNIYAAVHAHDQQVPNSSSNTYNQQAPDFRFNTAAYRYTSSHSGGFVFRRFRRWCGG
jgi:hypothetical protein